MAMLTMDWHHDSNPPRRGDVLCFPRTRYLVLSVRPVKRRDPGAGPRFKVWAAREKELEASTIAALRSSAHRRGGRREHGCYWNPRMSKRKTFEQLMREGH